jgi:site-specific DNA-methyltransferase (adenine-specific)
MSDLQDKANASHDLQHLCAFARPNHHIFSRIQPLSPNTPVPARVTYCRGNMSAEKINAPYKRKEVLGSCTLYLGNARDIIPTLAHADHVITDPPYGEETKKNARTHRNQGFNEAARSHYIGFSISEADIRSIFDSAALIAKRWVIASMEFRHAARFEADPPNGLRFIRMGCWIKTNGAPQFTGDRPAQGWEAVAIMHKDGERLRWNGGGARAVWQTGAERNNGHPTPKPLSLMRDWIGAFTEPGETILDPFMGSGTTLVACAQMGCKGTGIEINEDYFNLACQRVKDAYAQPSLFTPQKPAPQQSTFL